MEAEAGTALTAFTLWPINLNTIGVNGMKSILQCHDYVGDAFSMTSNAFQFCLLMGCDLRFVKITKSDIY